MFPTPQGLPISNAPPFGPEPGTRASVYPPIGRANATLIGLCVALALASSFGSNAAVLRPFFISGWLPSSENWLLEVRQGEIWRLFTPAFIHLSVAHLIFNMLGMQSLGSAVEARHGSWFYLALTAALAAVTDLAQYFTAGPYFGGMSGVLYGLFGYIWLRGLCDPASGFQMPRSTILIALVWLGACFTGVLGPIANTAHVCGLALGAICGAVSGFLAARGYQSKRPA
jgi:GlpG protein